MDRKLAFIGTSVARTCEWDADGSSLVACAPSAFLLDLIRDGFEVVILTTRHRLFPEDACWRKLVDAENIYVQAQHCYSANDPTLIAIWKNAFARFGLTPPSDVADDSWLSWKSAAEEQGVVTGEFSESLSGRSVVAS